VLLLLLQLVQEFTWHKICKATDVPPASSSTLAMAGKIKNTVLAKWLDGGEPVWASCTIE
jgi:hypothetical protein